MAEKTDLKEIARQEQERHGQYRCRIFCCAGTACLACGTTSIAKAIEHSVASHELSEKVEVIAAGCMSLCGLGPLLRVEIEGQPPVLYKQMEPLIARLMMAEHVIPALEATERGETFEVPPFLADHVLSLELPFFTQQKKIVLSQAGHIDPERIEAYIAIGGYQALQKVLGEMTPEQVIQQVKASGLRGRGGGGFSTGLKWQFGRQSEKGVEKFIICNGDEGDPGAYMDRAILESDPHAVLEGMLIAAYAVGAQTGWFYIRAEYPLAVQRIEKAVRQARKFGLLGKNILGSDLSFDCEVRLGAGAFVCGEETALIHSIEGQRGSPSPKPPYPTDHGLWGEPTCINNVETLANIRHIVLNGSDWFSSIGTETSKGTKVFALTGKVAHAGLIEVPMGLSLETIIEQIGGGSEDGSPLKAVQTGGPSGGVIPRELWDVPVCYEEQRRLGTMIGSGGMIVMGQDDSMVRFARFYIGFAIDESCGKCAPCRIGGVQMAKLLDKFVEKRATQADLDELRRLAHAMQKASLCGLGQAAPTPVLSTLKYFEHEYLDRIDPDAQPPEAMLGQWYPGKTRTEK